MTLSRFSRLDMLVMLMVVVLVLGIGVTLVLNQSDPPIEGASIAFLRTDETGEVANIWFVDPANPEGARQITSSRRGVVDFSVSPDGQSIVYTEVVDDAGNTDIMHFNLSTNRAIPLTNCLAESLSCAQPVWRPNGQTIAYQREQTTEVFTGITVYRIWLMDVENPANTYPLVQDETILGIAPQWSTDGSKLSFYDGSAFGIWVYNFEADSSNQQAIFLQSYTPASGVFSPDGTQLIYANYLLDANLNSAFLQIADLTTQQFNDLVAPEDDMDNRFVRWHPNGESITIARRYADYERFTHGHQIYTLDRATGESALLIYEEQSSHEAFVWHTDGNQLLFQRQSAVQAFALPEVWLYDAEIETQTRIATNAYSPAWITAP